MVIQFGLGEMSHLIIFCLKMSYEISSEIESRSGAGGVRS